MTFQLRVEFAGLCFHLIHPDGRQVGIVMPDARRHGKKLKHPDGEKEAIPHVGYLRYDLADAGLMVPSGPRKDPDLTNVDSPQYEAVHLFDFEELDFGLGFDEPLSPPKLAIANFGRFAPTVTPIPSLFSTEPPAALLMRTILRGGKLDTAPPDDKWKIDDLFNPGVPYGGKFAGETIWTRPVYAEELVLRVNTFGGKTKAVIRLKPANEDRIVRLKIANLCADNPLEWQELGIKRTSLANPADEDFKWFYRLLKHPDGTFEELTKDQGKLLPHPVLDASQAGNEGGGPNCGEGQKCWDYVNDQPCPEIFEKAMIADSLEATKIR